jgi:hypothetical protein
VLLRQFTDMLAFIFASPCKVALSLEDFGVCPSVFEVCDPLSGFSWLIRLGSLMMSGTACLLRQFLS